MGTNCRERRVERAERSRHQRLLREVACIGDQIARGEIVRTVGNHVIILDQFERVLRVEPEAVLLDGDMRIKPADCGRRTFHLGRAELGRAVDHLTLQIRKRHHIVVDHSKGSDAGRGQIEQRRRAQAAGTHHQHASAAERGLSRSAHLAQHDMAGVAFKFFGTQLGGQHAANIGDKRRSGDRRKPDMPGLPSVLI